VSDTPALITTRGGERQRYPLPLTPDALREEILVRSPGKPATHLIRLTVDLDVYNPAPGQQPNDTLLADLAFFRLLPTAQTVYLEWGERLIPVQPAQIEVRELAFSPDLAPVRAEVNVALRVLTDGLRAMRYAAQLEAWAGIDGERSAHPSTPGTGRRSAGGGRRRGGGVVRDVIDWFANLFG
jgi:hypothetical protein